MLESSSVAAQLVASREGFSSMKLVYDELEETDQKWLRFISL
jgi:hypothetical protein